MLEKVEYKAVLPPKSRYIEKLFVKVNLQDPGSLYS